MDPDELETEPKFSEVFTRNYNVCEVLDLIADYCDGIEQCRGKTVAAVFGVTQAGKSTTINALAHGALTLKARRRNQCTFALPDDIPKEKQAEMGTGTVGCTKAPKCFSLGGEGDEVLLLDTRGFFDERYPNEMIASSILTQVALDEAKEVKLIFLQRCECFFGGHVGMGPFGRMFGNLVRSNDIPALFLFNDYRWPIDASSDEEKVKKVIEEMKDEWKNTEEAKNNQLTEAVSRIIVRILQSPQNPVAGLNYRPEQVIDIALGKMKHAGTEVEEEAFHKLNQIIKDDEEYKSEQKKMLYLEAMTKAFNGSVSDNCFSSTIKFIRSKVKGIGSSISSSLTMASPEQQKLAAVPVQQQSASPAATAQQAQPAQRAPSPVRRAPPQPPQRAPSPVRRPPPQPPQRTPSPTGAKQEPQPAQRAPSPVRRASPQPPQRTPSPTAARQ